MNTLALLLLAIPLIALVVIAIESRRKVRNPFREWLEYLACMHGDEYED